MPRIVVVDDSALIRRKVEEMLVSAGFDVVAVASGEEAVALTLREPFDLVVSDVRMGAMTGVQLCRVLRSDALTCTMPIVLLTASDDARSRFWGRHGGADAYLGKDAALSLLVPTVERLLAARGPLAPETTRRPLHVDAAARVSAVLDRQLFDAVIASEIRMLLSHAADRAHFLAAAAEFLRDVLAVPYAALTIHGRETSHALVVRKVTMDPELAVLALGLDPTPTPAVVVFDGEPNGNAGMFEAGVVESFTISTAGELLGELRLYGGSERIGTDDRSTALLVVESLEPVLRSLLLFEETRRLANVDALTGIANRRTLAERLELEDRRVKRYGGDLSIILIDVDHFKSVNDTYGHTVGDVVLHAVAFAVKHAVRNVDLAGRWGGEEFLVVLPNCDSEGAKIVGERIRAAIGRLGPFEDGPLRVTASAGIGTRSANTPSAFELVDVADTALYEAKRTGRDKVVVAIA